MTRNFLLTCTLLLALTGLAWAASGNLDQARNGGVGDPPISPVLWVNGNLNQSHSHYAEGQSVPYRLVLEGLSLGAHTAIIEWDIKHNDRNALDYITHFQRIGQVVDPLSGLAGPFGPPSTFPIPEPIPSITALGVPQPQTSFNSLPADQRLFTIYNGTITALTYINNAGGNLGDLTAAQSETRLKIDFIATAPTVVLAWGGHIAAYFEWGDGQAAGNINGSPYHTRFIELDGSGGNQDRSLSAKAICVLPVCTIVGPDNVCESSQTTYEVQTFDSACTYEWSITGDGVIIGPTTGPSVTVQPAAFGQFTLCLVVSRGIEEGGCFSRCCKMVTINNLPGCDIQGPSSSCPGVEGLTFTAPAFDGTYSWSISGNGTIDGPTNARTVTVNAGDGCNQNFELTLVLEKNGCTGTCKKTVVVQDITPPEIAPKQATISVQCSKDVPLADINAVTASDNCDPTPVVTWEGDSSDGKSCPETITRTYKATDRCGNSATCTQTIVVDDTIAPTINVKEQRIVVECAGDVPPPDINAATASDNCDESPTVTWEGDISDGNSCPETIIRTYKATDECGNFSTAAQTIVVGDETGPTIAVKQPTITVECEGDVPPPTAEAVTVSDNCDANPKVTFESDVSDGNSCPETITRTYKATDLCGNSSIATQTIVVDDTTPPTIEGAVNRVVYGWGVPCEKIVPNRVSVKDNCDPDPTVVFTRSDGKLITDPFPGDATTTVTVTATDDCQNTTVRSFDIQVICVPLRTIGGTKYYDLEANYVIDPEDPPIPGWRIEICYTLPDGETGCQTATTNELGFWSIELPEGSTFAACEIMPGKEWRQTGPEPGDTVKAGDQVVATANGGRCWVGTVLPEPIIDLNFLNVCVVPATGGYTKGFWTNKNGEAVLLANDPAWRTLLNDLCLRNEDGTNFDVTLTGPFKNAFTSLRGWLRDSRSVNMAFMLSAQLAACTLDIQYMGLDSDAKLFLPKDLLVCLGGTDLAPITVGAAAAMANAELCAHGTASPSDPWRSYQGCLEKLIDGINNNKWPFISPEPCVPTYPAE